MVVAPTVRCIHALWTLRFADMIASTVQSLKGIKRDILIAGRLEACDPENAANFLHNPGTAFPACRTPPMNGGHAIRTLGLTEIVAAWMQLLDLLQLNISIPGRFEASDANKFEKVPLESSL